MGEGMPKAAISESRLQRPQRQAEPRHVHRRHCRDHQGTPLTDDEYLKAAVLGWGIELLRAFFLVSDDMMDSSITRRCQPCWYPAPEVGQIAINDSFMLEAAIYYLLKRHFRGESYYVDILELLVYLPVALTMYMSHVPQSHPSRNSQTIEPYALAKSILIPLGEPSRSKTTFSTFPARPSRLARTSSITSARGA
ncbi:Polyprenyl synthetase-domain-containing protein [Armillaria nabsnona]|nr:Polyprenyl synthetase-domain-containing protein [Armillaria nabsnona]